ncbi:sterol desaturase [Synechococcus sp. PCC 7502]|uniref:sterol desaturase family protein n=1 Tax=Synechococcus sp. PCC 7502 TaxID=1173263 RepID=UPI00029FF0BF|nr:sterol desaturase family protein [Synechococcus sp. PCC 7502]AFY74099.1 sterol desaturase [Synechococcus sp. PCC 7502]
MKIVIGFIILCIFFGAIEHYFPLNPQQKRFRSGWFTDVVHFFISHFLINVGSYVGFVALYLLFYKFMDFPWLLAVCSQPPLLQFLEAFAIAHLSFYIIHRLAHTNPYLWKFHTIHHSSSELDWLASVRIHPIEGIVTNVAVGLPLFFLGFNKDTFGIYLIFSAILPILNHANTKLSFPILRWLIATPEFHHWHHNNDSKSCNFSGFPAIDLIFGTFYLPKNRMPDRYGIDSFVPQNYWQQLIYPFKNNEPKN